METLARIAGGPFSATARPGPVPLGRRRRPLVPYRWRRGGGPRSNMAQRPEDSHERDPTPRPAGDARFTSWRRSSWRSTWPSTRATAISSTSSITSPAPSTSTSATSTIRRWSPGWPGSRAPSWATRCPPCASCRRSPAPWFCCWRRRIAKELGGGAWAQTLAALAVLFAPVLLYMSNTYLDERLRRAVLLGRAAADPAAVAGGRAGARACGPSWGWFSASALLNKISVLFLGFGFAVALLATPHRRKLLTAGPWLCGGIALVLFAPHLLWQVVHGWPTPEFMHNAATLKNKPLGFARLPPDPDARGRRRWLSCCCWPGCGYLLRRPRAAPRRHHLSGGFPGDGGRRRQALLPGGLLSLPAAPPAPRERRAAGWPARPPACWSWPAALLALTGIALLPMTVPMLPVETFIAYQKAAAGRPDRRRSERKAVGPLPQHYADMFGHRELVDVVAKAFRALPPEEQKNVTIYANSYAQAGAVSLFGPALGLPKAVGGQNSYLPVGAGRPRLADGDHPGRRAGGAGALSSRRSSWPARFSHPYAMPWRNDYPIVIGRGPKHMSIAEMWPHHQGVPVGRVCAYNLDCVTSSLVRATNKLKPVSEDECPPQPVVTVAPRGSKRAAKRSNGSRDPSGRLLAAGGLHPGGPGGGRQHAGHVLGARPEGQPQPPGALRVGHPGNRRRPGAASRSAST